MLSVDRLSKGFCGQELFDNISFTIGQKEKVGLIGRNGHGKTTLFKILVGEDHQDSGTVNIPRDYRIGYVSQKLNFTESTVRAEGARFLPENEKDELWRVDKILFGLGFTSADLEKAPKEISGGYQVRLNLARMLISDPDLLLLDEPTNYLDITSIRWLERYLQEWPRELLLITHDRNFMDVVVTHSMAIHRQKIKKIAGGTSKLYEQIAQEEELYERTRINDEKKRKDVEVFINRFRAKANLSSLVQSRVKQLERMEKKDKLSKLKNLDFEFNFKQFTAKYIMQVNNLTFGYTPEKALIKNLNIHIGAQDRICIIGRNGQGKSTLLKLLTGVQKMQHGEVVWHNAADFGYFVQTNVQTLNDDRTVEEEIYYTDPAMERQRARDIAGSMMFEGDAALKKIGVLSGGEKSRVLLGKLVVKPVNILFLDEPTNHLDMDSCDSLLAALDNFDGAVVMVTHNEMFLHALADRLIVFQNDCVDLFEGSYESFLKKVGWSDEKKGSEIKEDNATGSINKKELRKIRSEILTEKSKTMKPLEKIKDSIELEITDREKHVANINNELIEAANSNAGQRIALLSTELHREQKIIDDLYTKLDSIMTEFEQKNIEFELKLNEIDGLK